MLINTCSFLSQLLQAQESSVPEPLSFANCASGHVKLGMHFRKEYIFNSFYKVVDLEAFKANKENALLLAQILSWYLNYFYQDLQSLTIITTPARYHTKLLGFHFASLTLQHLQELTGINYIPDAIQTNSTDKFDFEFTQAKPLPANCHLLLFDDIFTTGRTIYACIDLLKSNTSNSFINANFPILIGINNN